MRIHRWDLLTWTDVASVSGNEKAVAFLPVGSVEQHGPHLPLGTDYLIADWIAEEVAKALNDEGLIAIKLPPIPYGLSSMWSAYPGTLTLKSHTFIDLVKEVITSIIASGVERVLVVNGHAGNSDALKVACRDAVEALGRGEVASITLWELCGDLINDVFETPFFHADEVETSVMLAAGYPVREPLREGGETHRRYSEVWHSLDLTVRPKAYVFRPESGRMHGPGSFGRPDLATRVKGDKLLKCMVDRLRDFAKDFIEGNI